MPRTRVPVIVLAGALGSGKTTLLNHLLRSGRGRLGVILNDFGDVDVDGLLVSGQVDAARSIAGGCLCCIADTSGLDDALAQLARPELALDAIIVEGSGLAEPRQLARLVIQSPADGVRFGGIVEVLDLRAWRSALGAEGEASGRLPVAPDRLRVASLIVANKAADGPDRAEVERLVREAGAAAPIAFADFGRIDPELLVDAEALREDAPDELPIAALLREASGADAEAHDHVHAVSASARDARPADPLRLLEVLESPPRGVVRAKGVVWFDAPGHARDEYVVQAVGGWVALERRRREPGAARETRLVLIGVDADRAELDRAAASALADPGAPRLEEPDLWGVLRYARELGEPAEPEPELGDEDDAAARASDA